MNRRLQQQAVRFPPPGGLKDGDHLRIEATRLAQATLDALPVHACVLDENGVILSVNRAWREFARANPPLLGHYLAGANYLEVCDRARGPGADEAAAFAAGIRAVLRGEVEQFSLEYACPAPCEERWFAGLVTRFPVTSPPRVVVSHQNITNPKQAEAALLASEERLNLALNAACMGVWEEDLQASTIFWSPECYQIFGVESFDGRVASFQNFIHPEDAARIYISYKKALSERATFATTFRIIRPDGQVRWVSNLGRATYDENGVPVRVVGIVRDITSHKEAEEAVRQSQHNLQALIENTDGAIWSVDSSYRLIVGNRLFHAGMRDIIGREVMPGEDLTAIGLPPPLVNQAKRLCDRALGGESFSVEIATRLVPGAHIIEYRLSPIRTAEGQISGVTIFGRDTTRRREAEAARAELQEQLRQAQKMESIGRLAGGVAHDFNNLLTVIRGYSDLILDKTSQSDPRFEMTEQVRQAAEQAAGLTRQLLAFSRRQILAPVVLDLNELVANLTKMLGRLIGEDIALSTLLQPRLWPITTDPGQIEQVIINLAVNARDAMPTGGKLTIETSNVQLDPGFILTHPEAPTGPCVLLTISDTGHGIEAGILPHIFEPFFTTKEMGQGTGLGLATVYGIVKQSGGDITVESEPGRGTAFKIYLPAEQAATVLLTAPAVETNRPRGSETILLVEDEAVVRSLVLTMLTDQGYTLLEASHGHAALALARQHRGPIDLLLTDVVMPEMSGRDLAEQLKAQYPCLKVLFMSGYTDHIVVRHGLLTAQAEFLPKPFSPTVLAVKVRELLDK